MLRLNARIATLHHADPEEKLHRAKAIGRIAYWIARAANLVGVLEIQGEEKHLREFRGGLLFIDLREPFRLPLDAGLSRLRISYIGKRSSKSAGIARALSMSFFPTSGEEVVPMPSSAA